MRPDRTGTAAAPSLAGSNPWLMLQALMIGVLILAVSPARADVTIGGTVSIEEPVDETTAIAGVVKVAAPVSGDLTALGGTISVEAPVEGDVDIIGGSASINSAIQGDVDVVTGSLIVGASTRIHGDLEYAGGSITMDGVVLQDFDAAAGSVTIRGRIMGDVEISAPAIRILPGASFGGAVRFYSAVEPDLPEGVVIEGPYSFQQQESEGPLGLPPLWDSQGRPTLEGLAIFTGLFVLIGLILLFISPRQTDLVMKTMSRRPLASFMTGAGFLVLAPIAGGLLCATILGVVLGLPLLLLYPFVLLAGFGYGILGLVRAFGGRLSQPMATVRVLAALVLVPVVLYGLTLVPVAGALISGGVLIMGTGAFTTVMLYGDRSYQRDPNPPV